MACSASRVTIPSSTRAVRFDRVAIIREYRKGAELRPTWYSPSDYKRFRSERFEDAHRIGETEWDDLEDDECFWGLEKDIVSQLKKDVARTKASVIRGVLAEQDAQRLLGWPDPDDISKASRAHSGWSASVARKKALCYSSELSTGNPISQNPKRPLDRPYPIDRSRASRVRSEWSASVARRKAIFYSNQL